MRKFAILAAAALSLGALGATGAEARGGYGHGYGHAYGHGHGYGRGYRGGYANGYGNRGYYGRRRGISTGAAIGLGAVGLAAGAIAAGAARDAYGPRPGYRYGY